MRCWPTNTVVLNIRVPCACRGQLYHVRHVCFAQTILRDLSNVKNIGGLDDDFPELVDALVLNILRNAAPKNGLVSTRSYQMDYAPAVLTDTKAEYQCLQVFQAIVIMSSSSHETELLNRNLV